MAVNRQDMMDFLSQVELRSMDYTDLASVIAIEEKAYPHPWTIGIFRDCLRVGYSAWVLSLSDDGLNETIIGYAVLMLSPGEAHILNICIDPDYQRHGLGRYLLHHMIRQCQQTDVDMLLLEVRRSNTAAQALYRSEGFHELGVRKAYYPADEGREDALILAKALAGAARNEK